MSIVQSKIKRLFDVCCSIIILYIIAPFIVGISIIIKLTSKGPVFFKQERLGKNGKVFEIMKFRTMIDNAVNTGPGLSTYEGDPRVTKVGGFLRKTSLDELPQLFNVLKGDMSLIGPRPPVPYHPRNFEEYSERQALRFEVTPGITGYAQVKGRNSLTWDERFEFDIKYVKRQSLLMDLVILILTIIKVFSKEDIHGPERRKKKYQ